MACSHENYRFDVNCYNLADTGGRTADITGKCADCGLPIRFRGLPLGVSTGQPTMSLDGTELRAPFSVGDEPDVLEGIGFTVTQVIPEQ